MIELVMHWMMNFATDVGTSWGQMVALNWKTNLTSYNVHTATMVSWKMDGSEASAHELGTKSHCKDGIACFAL
jgi:hypothetical protein